MERALVRVSRHTPLVFLTRFDGGAAYIGDDKYDPVWEELDRRGAVVFLHGTQTPSSTPYPHPFLGLPITEVRRLHGLIVKARLTPVCTLEGAQRDVQGSRASGRDWQEAAVRQRQDHPRAPRRQHAFPGPPRRRALAAHGLHAHARGDARGLQELLLRDGAECTGDDAHCHASIRWAQAYPVWH